MPYRMLEEIQDRRKEKVAVFLTTQNIFGLVIMIVPTYVLTPGLPMLLRGLALMLSAVIGFAITLDHEGLPLYERGLWYARGILRRAMSGAVMTPESLMGAIVQHQQDRAIQVDGPIQPIQRVPRARRNRLAANQKTE